MNIQITNLFQFTMLLISIACPSFLLAQANTPPTGSSTNLCPKQTYRYTSAAANDGGLCNRFGGWEVENGKITSDGVGSNNSVWADVQWDNVASGKIGNFCGVLTVSINSIAQPTISGSSTVSLCGSGSITLQASVSSTTNITGYIWNIVGTGVSPTGLISTTAPQITINYANWAAGSSLSATVAVGTKNSCGFTTRTTPLVAIDPIPGIPNSGEPAIPRSAWVQLSPGNISSLQAPLNFTNTIICSTGTVSVSNQPSGSNLTWESSNTSRLTIDSNTGFATRQNNYNGPVEIRANLSNACGSFTQTTNVWLGLPAADNNTLIWAGTRGVNPVTTSPGATYTFQGDNAPGATSYTWLLPNGFTTLEPLWAEAMLLQRHLYILQLQQLLVFIPFIDRQIINVDLGTREASP